MILACSSRYVNILFTFFYFFAFLGILMFHFVATIDGQQIVAYNSIEVVEMNNMAYYRNKKNLSQQNVADYLGISRQAYCNYETGKREASYETLLKLAECLETSVDELLRERPTSQEVNDEDIMFALFDGATEEEITPEMYAEVKHFAKFILERERNKNE